MKLVTLKTDKLNDDSLFETWYVRMPEERIGKIDRIRCRKDKNLSLGAGILEYSYAGRFRYSNLSHSHEMAVIALSEQPVGVDTEMIRTAGLCSGNIAGRFFTQEECEYIKKTGDRGFFRIWTIREAFMKATGKGLALGMESFHTSFSEGIAEIIQDYDSNNWIISEFEQDGYLIAVCGFEKFEKPESFVL